MATISAIMNLVTCGAASVLGTGVKGCKAFLKKVTTIWLIPQGFVFDDSRELNEAYVKELQADGTIIVLKGIRTFTDNTPEDTTEELEDGTKQITRLGLYEFALSFINGLFFNAALSSLSGFGNYDVVFWDREGNGLFTKSTSGSIKGMTVGMHQQSKIQWATDSTAQREGFMFQLMNRKEVDSDYVFIQNTQVDFDANQLDGINEVGLAFAVAPVATDTQVTIKAWTKQNSKPFTGADYSNFLIQTNGSTTNPTAGDDSATAGTYVLTGITALSLNDVVTADLYDNSGNSEVITLAGDLYKSKTISATVV